jgi:hypothetical protein
MRLRQGSRGHGPIYSSELRELGKFAAFLALNGLNWSHTSSPRSYFTQCTAPVLPPTAPATSFSATVVQWACRRVRAQVSMFGGLAKGFLTYLQRHADPSVILLNPAIQSAFIVASASIQSLEIRSCCSAALL